MAKKNEKKIFFIFSILFICDRAYPSEVFLWLWCLTWASQSKVIKPDQKSSLGKVDDACKLSSDPSFEKKVTFYPWKQKSKKSKNPVKWKFKKFQSENWNLGLSNYCNFILVKWEWISAFAPFGIWLTNFSLFQLLFIEIRIENWATNHEMHSESFFTKKKKNPPLYFHEFITALAHIFVNNSVPLPHYSVSQIF